MCGPLFKLNFLVFHDLFFLYKGYINSYQLDSLNLALNLRGFIAKHFIYVIVANN